MRSILMNFYYGLWASLASLPQILRVVIVVFVFLIPIWWIAKVIIPKILFVVWRLLNLILIAICILIELLLWPLKFISPMFYVHNCNSVGDILGKGSEWLLSRPLKWKVHFFRMIIAGVFLTLVTILPNLIGHYIPNEYYYAFSYLHNAYLKIEGPALSRASNYQQLIHIEDTNFMEDEDSLGDVSTEAYFYDAVDWAVRKGITQGTSETTFSPEKDCTRVHMLMFLWRASGEPEPTIDNPYNDVESNSYFSKAVIWAYEVGLISDTTLNGGKFVSRAEAIPYLWRLAGEPIEGNTDFVDVLPESDFFNAASWSVAEGIIEMESDDSFSPERICTRGQVVTFMYKYFVM